MTKDTVLKLGKPEGVTEDPFTEILRKGAKGTLVLPLYQPAIERL